MKRFARYFFTISIIALAGGNLSAAVTHTLIDIQDTLPFEHSASAAQSRLQSPLLLAGETKTVTKTKTKTKTKTVDEDGNLSKTKTKTKTTTTSTSDDSDSESSDSGNTDYHGASYEGY